MHQCPKCPNHALTATLLASGLSARSCKHCKGVWLDLVGYRAWAEQRGVDAVTSVSASRVEVDDTSHTLTCVQCGGIMTKFRLRSDAENRLDYCHRCDAVFLDDGEWEQLTDLGLRQHLGTVFTAPWQRRVQSERQTQLRDANLRERLGPHYQTIADFRTWLHALPEFETAAAWLTQKDD